MQRLYGITHNRNGEALIRVPRLLKIGIGVSRGPGLYSWIQWDEKREKLQWMYRCYAATKAGEKPSWFIAKTRVDVLDARGDSNRAEAESVYRQLQKQVVECKYPQKLAYFTFTHPVVVDKQEMFEPDFEAIEKHGPTPTSIDIVLMEDEPLTAEYAMWSTAELRCHGDGLQAMRVMSMADPETAAQYAGEKYFPVSKCACGGCEYFAEKDGKPAPCKPSGDLRFHLLNDIRIGGTAYFHTSGYRSISWFFSSLEQLRQLTGGRLRGVPVRMSLRAYKTKHNGQVATQYGVWLEFRAENVAALRKNLMQAAMEFQQLAPAPKQIEAPVEQSGAQEEAEEIVTHSATAMTAEFYPDAQEEEEQPEEASPKAATEAKGKALKEDMMRAQQATPGDPAAANAAASMAWIASQDVNIGQQGRGTQQAVVNPKPPESAQNTDAPKPATRELF